MVDQGELERDLHTQAKCLKMVLGLALSRIGRQNVPASPKDWWLALVRDVVDPTI